MTVRSADYTCLGVSGFPVIFPALRHSDKYLCIYWKELRIKSLIINTIFVFFLVTVVFVIKLNRKGDEVYTREARNMIVYLLDQYQRRNPLRRIVALLDMTGVGLSNVVSVILAFYFVVCVSQVSGVSLFCLMCRSIVL